MRDCSKHKDKGVKVEFANKGNSVTRAGNSFSVTNDVLAVIISSLGDDWVVDSGCVIIWFLIDTDLLNISVRRRMVKCLWKMVLLVKLWESE